MNIKRDANKREHQQADALGMTRCAGSGACIICGSKYNVRNNLCNKHYLQVYRHGKILTRTIYDCNEIVKYDKHAEIILYDNNCNEVARTKIDLEDIERCSKHKWCLAVKGYVVSFIDGKLKYIHQFLLKYPDSIIDHINHNKLDNCKSNLRIVTTAQNNMNKVLSIRNTSGMNGVSWDKSRNKWQVCIGIHGKTIHLGRFNKLCDAIKIRKQAEIQYYGEYSGI